MSVSYMEILHNERAGQRSLGLDRATRDALGAYCKQLWPANTAKFIAREWDLSLDEARGIVAGRASQATIDKVFKHPNGGWRVVLPVLGSVIGHGVDGFFREQIKQAAKAQQHAEEHERLARQAYRRLARDADLDGDHGDDPAPTREARRSFGAVGASTARRLEG